MLHFTKSLAVNDGLDKFGRKRILTLRLSVDRDSDCFGTGVSAYFTLRALVIEPNAEFVCKTFRGDGPAASCELQEISQM